MISHLKQIGKHTAIFSFSNILSKGIGFLLLPLYTRYLSPADYGILELLSMTLQISVLLSIQGIPQAFFQKYTFKFKDDEVSKTKALSTAFFYIILTVGVYCSIFYVFADYINNIFFESNKYSDLLRVIAITCFLQCITFVPNALLRAQLKSVQISIVSIIQLISNISLNVYFVVALSLGVKGIIYGNLIAALIYVICIYILTVKKLSFSFSSKILKEMLSFGLPMVPAGLSLFILNGSDRFFLQKFSTTHQLGLYALGYKICAILQIVIIQPFILVWPSIFFPLAKEPDAQVTFGRLTSVFYLILLFIGLVFILISKPLVTIMAPEVFWGAHTVCVWIIPSIIFYGLYHILNIGINIKERTKLTPVIVGNAALLNLVLNYLLIPKYGMSGAAISTFLSSFLMAALAYFINNRYFPIVYQWGFLFKISAVFGLSVLLINYFESNNIFFHVLISLAILAFFVAGIFISMILTKRERENMKILLRSFQSIVSKIFTNLNQK